MVFLEDGFEPTTLHKGGPFLVPCNGHIWEVCLCQTVSKNRELMISQRRPALAEARMVNICTFYKESREESPHYCISNNQLTNGFFITYLGWMRSRPCYLLGDTPNKPYDVKWRLWNCIAEWNDFDDSSFAKVETSHYLNIYQNIRRITYGSNISNGEDNLQKHKAKTIHHRTSRQKRKNIRSHPLNSDNYE